MRKSITMALANPNDEEAKEVIEKQRKSIDVENVKIEE